MKVNQYKKIEKIFTCLCEAADIDNKDIYFKPERLWDSQHNKNYLYYRLCYSIQNTGHMRNSIKMGEGKNGTIIAGVLCDFDHEKVLETYSCGNEIYEALKNKGITDNGKGDKTKTNWEKFCEGAFSGAQWLVAGGRETVEKLVSNAEVMQEVSEEYVKKLVEISKQIPYMGLSLVCDWLKECGCIWLVKPDVHIRNVYAHFAGKEDNVSEQEVIKEMYKWSLQLREYDKKMTAYKLDRMIWLICTGNFFIDHKKIGRDLLTAI